MTRPFSTKNLRFFMTAPAPCPYLEGRRERKVFTGLDGKDAALINETLTQSGFRRSQNIAYRPACDLCDSCISARVVVHDFDFKRRWRKILARNDSVTASMAGAEATEEQFWLLRRYLLARHERGGMAEMTLPDYASMVEESPVTTRIVEYRDKASGDLVGCALIDVLRDGLSLVYSFFDTKAPARSFGSFIILDHIRRAARAELPHVYLGYWVPGSVKMDYKRQYQPLELLWDGAWRPFAETPFAAQPEARAAPAESTPPA